MSATERLLFEIAASPQIKAERKWLDAFVEAKVILGSRLGHSMFLDNIHQKMLDDRVGYLLRVEGFKKEIDCDFSEVYVVVGGASHLIFLPRHKDYLEIKQRYERQCQALDLSDIYLPFNILLIKPYSQEGFVGKGAGFLD